MLGQHHRDRQVVNQTGDGGQDLFGRRGVQGGGRFIEHQDAGMGREYRAYGHPLLLAAGQFVQGAVAEIGDTEKVERLFDSLAHHVDRHRQLLHGVGQFFLDGIGHESSQRVLTHESHNVRQLPRWLGPGLSSFDQHPPSQGPPGEVRHQAVDDPQQRRLPHPGSPHHQRQLTFLDTQSDLAQGRRRRIGVGDGDLLELDHAGTSVRGERDPAPCVS